MRKVIGIFLALFCVGPVIKAQTVINDLHVEKREVGSFTGIEVATGIRLTLTHGNTEEVAVSAAEPEFRDRIITKVDNGILKIYVQDRTGAINTKHVKKELKAYVSYKTLELLDVNTGAVVEIDGTLSSSSLKINANTGAKVNGKISINELKVDQNTGSIIYLSGNADKLDVEGSTGSKFEGADLATSVCDAKVSTGARVWVTASKELSAKANTGGNIKYKGEPSVTDIKKATGGTVSKI